MDNQSSFWPDQPADGTNARHSFPGHRGTDTSREATEAMKPHTGRLQALALAAVKKAGGHGLTADETSGALGIDRSAIQPRLTELRHKRLIADSGNRRQNASGKSAIVWVAVRPG